jgi:hypothetical protein
MISDFDDKENSFVVADPKMESSDIDDSFADDVDDARSHSKVTLRLTVPNFSDLNGEVQSPPTTFLDFPWNIRIQPTREGRKKTLGFFLQCNLGSESSSWSCKVRTKYRIVSRKSNPSNNFTRMTSHVFDPKNNCFGVKHFMPWREIVDSRNGFIKHDSVTFEVKVSASASVKRSLSFKEIGDALKCPVCLTTPKSGPILQCENGHLVCKDCFPRYNLF